MKRINLTENDIFKIVNKVIAEEISKKNPDKLTEEEKKQRKQKFLYGDNTVSPKIPGMKGRTFEIKDKRGLNIESFSFVLQDVEFIDAKKGNSAIVKGYLQNQEGDKEQLTVFEYVCGRFGEFILKEYQGLDKNDIKKQKTSKQKDDSESSFKNNVRQGVQNVGQDIKQGAQNIKQGAQDVAQNIKQGTQNIKQGAQNIKQGAQDVAQDIKQGAQNIGQDIKQGAQDVAQNVQGKVRQGVQNVKNKLKR